MSSRGSLSRFLSIHLGEAEDQRCQVVDRPQAASSGIAWSKPWSARADQKPAQDQGGRHLDNSRFTGDPPATTPSHRRSGLNQAVKSSVRACTMGHSCVLMGSPFVGCNHCRKTPNKNGRCGKGNHNDGYDLFHAIPSSLFKDQTQKGLGQSILSHTM